MVLNRIAGGGADSPMRRDIHIINPFYNASGGSEQRSLSLYNALSSRARVRLWSDVPPHPLLTEHHEIHPISLSLQKCRFPLGGTLVFVGVYFKIGFWRLLARPRRIILIYNTQDPKKFKKRYAQLTSFRLVKPEVVFACESLRETVPVDGIVHPSLIETTRFVPAQRASATGNDSFVVGRLSRDVIYKHCRDDVPLYRKLAADGVKVRIMGGTCLEPHMGGTEKIELLPACSEDAAVFLQGLDCFYYRGADTWYETFGRVIFEAMACGLPVVCENRGGYCPHIEHGVNGFLCDSQDEAYAIINRLRHDPVLRHSVGAAARKTTENMYSHHSLDAMLEYYLR
jgi:glycosyltransferase involved in cell wall biosynthesis